MCVFHMEKGDDSQEEADPEFIEQSPCFPFGRY